MSNTIFWILVVGLVIFGLPFAVHFYTRLVSSAICRSVCEAAMVYKQMNSEKKPIERKSENDDKSGN